LVERKMLGKSEVDFKAGWSSRQPDLIGLIKEYSYVC
jgi:hypothetical protein